MVGLVPLIALTIMLLALLRRATDMWRLCFVGAACSAISVWVSAILPAAGAFAHDRVAPAIVHALPPGARLFYMKLFIAFWSGQASVIDISHLEGVVTFPSYHAVMALMLGDGLGRLRGCRWPAWLWSGLIMFSTIPIGGHYAIDLIAGGLLWLVAMRVTRRTQQAFNPTRQ